MKKTLLIVLSILFAIGVEAQGTANTSSNQGSGARMWIGGSGGFYSSNDKFVDNSTKDLSSFEYNIGPSFGFMLNDKMAVGINVSFNSLTKKRNNNTSDETINTGYAFQPFFRYYFAGMDNFKFYGDIAASFGGGKSKFTDNTGNKDREQKYGTFGLGLYAGAQYWFTPSWSMASSIGLLGYNSKTSNKGETDNKGNSIEEKTSGFGLNATFSSLSFSLFYHF